MSRFAPNVGPLDAAIRLVVGAALLVGMVVAVRSFDADWTLTLLLHPSILAAYLVMTGVARNDVVYHVFGWDTRRASRARRRDPGARPR